jgi:hypothetical protein
MGPHDAAIVEPPPGRDLEATGVAVAQVVVMGIALGRQRVDPHRLAGVVVGERGRGRLGASGT